MAAVKKSIWRNITKMKLTEEKCYWNLGVTKTKTLENEDLRPKTRLSFRDYEN